METRSESDGMSFRREQYPVIWSASKFMSGYGRCSSSSINSWRLDYTAARDRESCMVLCALWVAR
jgi:hypothetical protein